MSITLDINAFLNKDVCATACDDIIMEKEMETNIFDEIEHLLKFNKDLEYKTQQHKEEEYKKKTTEEPKVKELVNLDFLNNTTPDFLLTSDSQSLFGEDPLLFTVEHDRLQPISSRFMVPGIYKRIEGVASNYSTLPCRRKCNVFFSHLEKNGRIVTQKDFEQLYVLAEKSETPPLRRVLLLEPLKSNNEEDDDEQQKIDEKTNKKSSQQEANKDQIHKEWDALHRLAYNILKLANRDHIVIDRKRNEVIRTQYNTQQKTIYRFLAPELMGLRPSAEILNSVIDVDQEEQFILAQKTVNKLGRPRKRQQDVNTEKVANKIKKKEEKSQIDLNEKPNQINIRTRSGRLIKTPNAAPENNNHLLTSLATPPSSDENIKQLLNELQDADYKNSKIDVNKSANDLAEKSIDCTSPTPSKRKVPPEAVCPTCKKIFLGRRLQRHFTQHPDHMKISALNSTTSSSLNNNAYSSDCKEDMSLFNFLISKLQNSETLNEDQKADLFLNELNDLVEQLQLRSSRLIRNTSGLHFVNQRCSKLLGIPEGQYALDLTAIEAPLDPELTESTSTQNIHSQPNNINTRSLDYTNLSITLDETLTDEAAQKLNLSAGGKLLPPSEESLLRAVDDLVQTDINKIHASSMLQAQPPVANVNSHHTTATNRTSSVVAKLLPPHIDHASDNAVEASHMKETSTAITATDNSLLDLSVDFFQFNN